MNGQVQTGFAFSLSQYLSSSSNRLLRTCLLVSVTFLVCWFPFACLNPLMSYYPKWFGAPYGWVLHEVSIWLGKTACLNDRHGNQFRVDEFSIQSSHLLLRSESQSDKEVSLFCVKRISTVL